VYHKRSTLLQKNRYKKMSETPGEGPVDFNALGPHVGQALVAHTQRHEATVNAAERQSDLNALRTRLGPLIEAPTGRIPERTAAYLVEKRADGTQVSAVLTNRAAERADNPNLTIPIQSGGIGIVAKDMTDAWDDQGHSPLATKYLKDGPASQVLAGERLEESHIKDIPGLGIWAHLESQTEHLEHTTQDMVRVGILVDPKSIIVPDDGGQTPARTDVFRVIGPDDSRFEPIMTTMVDKVMAGISQDPAVAQQ
jgi:hypothetical protein